MTAPPVGRRQGHSRCTEREFVARELPGSPFAAAGRRTIGARHIPLVVLGISILLLLLLIARLKLNAFMALLLASFFVRPANHMTLEATPRSILEGIDDTAGSLMLILVFGAMLGKFIGESGAAHAISYALTDVSGLRHIQLSIFITGFAVLRLMPVGVRAISACFARGIAACASR